MVYDVRLLSAACWSLIRVISMYMYMYYKCFLSEWKTNKQKIHDHNWNPINPQSYTGAVELSLVLYCLFEAAWRLTAIIISPDEWWGENVKSTSRATARKSHKKSCLHKTHWLTKKDVASGGPPLILQVDVFNWWAHVFYVSWFF